MSIQKAAAIGVCAALIALQFKGGKTEYGIYICAGISLLIFFAVLDRIAAVVARLDEITAYIDLAPAYIEMLLKMLGITFVAEFSSALCRDAGYQTIAQQIEVFAKLAVLVLGLPVVFSLLELIGEFLS